MQDELIVRLYLERSEQAIEKTSEKYGAYCHTIAWNILYNSEDTEECVNDTYLHTWNSIPPQKPNCFRAFIGKITRNLALNRYESRHAQKRNSGEVPLCLDELSECVGGGSPVDSVIERMTVVQCINTFLEGLKPMERKVFVRRYWYAASVKEIAGEYELGESQVKMMLLRSREKLKALLEKEGVAV